MAPLLVTYEVAKAKFGTLLSIVPLLSLMTTRSLCRAINDALLGMPSNQSAKHGYAGMAAQPAIYVLRTNIPWVNTIDPGHHRPTDALVGMSAARNEQVIFDTGKLIYNSKVNVQTAVIDALNTAVPDKYKRMAGNQIGT